MKAIIIALVIIALASCTNARQRHTKQVSTPKSFIEQINECGPLDRVILVDTTTDTTHIVIRQTGNGVLKEITSTDPLARLYCRDCQVAGYIK